jgi:hypothetical protein
MRDVCVRPEGYGRVRRESVIMHGRNTGTAPRAVDLCSKLKEGCTSCVDSV